MARRAMPNAPPPTLGTWPTTLPPTSAAILSMFLATIHLLSRKLDFNIIAIHHKTDSPLIRLDPQCHQKGMQGRCAPFDGFLVGVALHDDRGVKNELSAP